MQRQALLCDLIRLQSTTILLFGRSPEESLCLQKHRAIFRIRHFKPKYPRLRPVPDPKSGRLNPRSLLLPAGRVFVNINSCLPSRQRWDIRWYSRRSRPSSQLPRGSEHLNSSTNHGNDRCLDLNCSNDRFQRHLEDAKGLCWDF